MPFQTVDVDLWRIKFKSSREIAEVLLEALKKNEETRRILLVLLKCAVDAGDLDVDLTNYKVKEKQ